ncbi:hypothetical protein BC332_00789 [Capsicum chinense]|nr:hypothetical protein BC332_00789 [Capsicum chinense]
MPDRRKNVKDAEASDSYLLSRRAKKIAMDVLQLQTKGRDYVDFSYPAPTSVGIEAIPSKGDEEFESRKLIEKEVMVALRDESVIVIGVYGMGGVGKIKLVYKERSRKGCSMMLSSQLSD